jgi:hypothetical protein
MRLALHPDGLAPRIANLATWREHLLDRLERQAVASGDPALRTLQAELDALPYDPDDAETELAAPSIAVPLRLRHDGGELTFVSTVTRFGTAMDVTLAELAIESFFPADATTADVVRAWAEQDAE